MSSNNTYCDKCPGCGIQDPDYYGYSCKLLQKKGFSFSHDCALGAVLTELQNNNDELRGEIWTLQERIDRLENQ